ncbi:MAG: alpha,2-fucosyltransferase [Bacteriovoracaceae bacterium]|nr:alpha,2-fucosyltransferase [Bacteriovoracaceae bacterium]
MSLITYLKLGQNGRLGNQLWQIAGTLGIANYLGQGASFSEWAFQKHFNVPEHFFSNQEGISAHLLATEIAPRHRMYLQDYHLFDQMKDTIRKYFKPSASTEKMLHEKYEWFFKFTDKTAVHIRRSDFLGFSSMYPVLPASYYEAAMSRIKSQFPNTEFFIFSDDIEWCKKNLKGELHFVSEKIPCDDIHTLKPVGNPTDVDDLLLMSLCEHHICSNSTYAWWAAYLSNDREPIIPLPWFGPDLSDMQMDHYILPSWIAIHYANTPDSKVSFNQKPASESSAKI